MTHLLFIARYPGWALNHRHAARRAAAAKHLHNHGRRPAEVMFIHGVELRRAVSRQRKKKVKEAVDEVLRAYEDKNQVDHVGPKGVEVRDGLVALLCSGASVDTVQSQVQGDIVVLLCFFSLYL